MHMFTVFPKHASTSTFGSTLVHSSVQTSIQNDLGTNVLVFSKPAQATPTKDSPSKVHILVGRVNN